MRLKTLFAERRESVAIIGAVQLDLLPIADGE